MSRSRRESTQRDYDARIDRVLDHVRANLEASHSLEELARVACFSPFHFHRVFRSSTGETLRSFVERARVERAAFLLGRGASARRMVDLAMECGFSSSAEFSRAFRARFGASPTEFRRARAMSKIPQDEPIDARYLRRHVEVVTSEVLSTKIVAYPERSIAYVRVANPFELESLSAATRALDAFLRSRGAAMEEWLGISHDDPEITPVERCRYDAAVVVPSDAKVGDEIAIRALPAATYVEVSVHGPFEAIEATWDRLFSEWLPSSGFEPGDGPGIERYDARPRHRDESRVDVVLALPIRSVRRV